MSFNAIGRPSISAVVMACALLAACKEPKDGAPGAPGASSLVQLSPEPAGANCATGGTRVQTGLDADADGVLDAAEVSATQFVCNGATGHDSLLALTPEAAGGNCAMGGTRVQSGIDADDDGILDAGEVSATQYVCTGATGADGRASLVDAVPEAAGINCAAGGLLVRSGFDANANGALDAGEVVLSQYLCNGVNGATALVATAPEAAGASCEFGGTRVDSGIDANGDGSLDALEASATQYVCNGAPGANGLNALIALTPEAPGASCASGGTRIDVGIDADGDGVLDAGEVSSTEYVCDGADGDTSLVVTTPEPAGANCGFAGLRIQSGIDANANLTLDQAEVGSTSYVCNGAPGADGQTSLVATSPEAAGAHCAWGGVRVVSGLDADGNGLLDGADPVLTQYVCDGAPGLMSLVATSPEPAGAHCAWGGIRVDSGLDADRSGALDVGEFGSTYVCNGADGLTALVATAPEAAGANCEFGGTRIDSGTDANRSGALDVGELASTYVCDGAPAPESLVATTAEAAGVNCEFGGSRIEFAKDANANGTVDPGEVEATAYACTGATGPALPTLLAFTPEPAGANCPYGGSKVESGVDLNGNGVLDAGEVSSTGYVCDGDSRHPYVLRSEPAPGSTILPDTRFCVTFSEPVVASYVDASSFFLARTNAPAVAAAISYDPATSTACLQPSAPLETFQWYTLYVNSRVRDAAGNRLLPTFQASYRVEPPPMPNLTVQIDSIVPSGGGVDVGYTVSNSDAGSASAFTLGFYVDRPGEPGPYTPPDASVELGALAGLDSTSGTIHLLAPPSASVMAYVDVWGTVAESDENDNVGRVWPAITGPISASATSVEELGTLTVTFPVSASVRYASVYLGTDGSTGPVWFVASDFVNGAGEGLATFTFQVPEGVASWGAVSIWVTVRDPAMAEAQYVAIRWVSPTNLATLDAATGSWVDSGIPLTVVTVTASTSPNLTVLVDGVADLGGGLLQVSYTVSNSGVGEAAPSTVGFFQDPPVLPGVGTAPDATAPVPAIPAGTSASGIAQVAGGPGAAILAFADVDGSVTEQNEADNLFVPAPLLTGPIAADPPDMERGSTVTVTVPVGPGVRSVNLSVGQDASWSTTWSLGQLTGNFAGEGFITGTLTVPTWWPDLTGASVWADLGDAWWHATRRYAANSWVSSTNLAVLDPGIGSWLDSGIPLTPVTVSASTRPNLTMIILSVTPSPGGIDVRFRASNEGVSDAGPFTIGIFVDPPMDPGVGAVPQGTFAVAGLAAGTAMAATTITVPGTAMSRVLGYVDLLDEVAEGVESDNVGRLAGRMTGSPTVTPTAVELTGGLTVTVPVNSSARNIQVELDTPMGSRSLGGASGNYDGEGSITGTFTIPNDPVLLGDRTLIVTVWDDGHQAGRRYVLDPSRSIGNYTAYDAVTSTFTNVTTFPVVTVTVVPSIHPNLTVSLGLVSEGLVPGTVDVPYTVSNASDNGAPASTLGFFVNPMTDPVAGSTPVASVDVGPLPAWASIEGTITLDAALTAYIAGYADVLGVVDETNENDNKGFPQPSMIGPIVATPAVVDEGTLLTLTIPVTGGTFNADVYLGHDHGAASPSVYLGSISGNWEGEGYIQGSVTVPPGTTWLGTVPVWVFLHNDGMNRTTAYVATPAISTTNYAMSDLMYGWTDSGIPLTVVQVIPPTRPNLSVAIGAVTDIGDGTVNVELTVRNTGAGAAAAFDVGVFVDPPSVPGAGSPTSGAVTIPSLGVGEVTGATVNVPGSAASAVFAYADVANAVDEQSETDNLDWVLPVVPAMTGSPLASASSAPVGGTVEVTVPVSASVRRIEIYLGNLASGDPQVLIGTATGNAAGEGSITGTCSLPVGSAGDWYVWVATYDLYDLDWRGYLSWAPVSSTHYTEYDPNLDGPPSGPTTIPLTALTVTP